MQVIKFYDYIFPADIRVVLNCSPRQYSSYVNKCLGQDYAEPPSKDGICEHYVLTEHPEKQADIYFLWMRDFNRLIRDYALLVHETSHLSINILKDCGVEIENNKEVLAYHQQFLFQTIISEAKSKRRN